MGSQPGSRQDEQMLLAAWLYYDEGFTHSQIAERLHVSRVKVTRLLQRARREGLVEIRITRPLPRIYQLQRRLEQRFGLRGAVVVPTAGTAGATVEAVGRAAAEAVSRAMFAGCWLGVGWSRTVSRMVPYVSVPADRRPAGVSELAGSFLRQETPYGVGRVVAERLGVPLVALPVPVMVQSEEVCRALLQEEDIRRALEHGRRCHVVVVGLGDVGPDCTMVRTGYLSRDDVADLRRRGAVGDMLMRYFDRHGRPVFTPLDGRIISMAWDDIRRLPHVVAVASGPEKTEAIRGALEGGLCHTLVTDADTAARVLEEVES